MGCAGCIPLLLFLLPYFSALEGSQIPKPIKQGKETWGYINVRPQAHIFFWLYYTTAPVDYKTRPLLLWLQGGPGASSTGIGNFVEIGPQNLALQNRTNAWTSEVNVVFVDNPVGTGFSYVEDRKALARNNSQIAQDLLAFLRGFFVKVPEFQTIPLYIFSESYGGKMAAQFAVTLSKAIKLKSIQCQLAGVAMGDSWISPVDAVLSWGPYLYATSLIDSAGKNKIDNQTRQISLAVRQKNWSAATRLWAATEDLIENVTNGVNFYNILARRTKNSRQEEGEEGEERREDGNDIVIPPPALVMESYLESLYRRHVLKNTEQLNKLMNGPVRDKLKIIPKNVTWGGQSKLVFEALADDFMVSAVTNVELLLNLTTIKVVVYNGQLDLIVCTPGAQKWVENLHWAGTQHWLDAKRRPIEDEGQDTGAFAKGFKNFTFYWILNAGHMIPADASDTAIKMMKEVVGIKEH